jgi:nucleotide-binding universal stress UspA family protein
MWRVLFDETKAWSADLVVVGAHGRRGLARSSWEAM